jgi:hypothetical protein
VDERKVNMATKRKRSVRRSEKRGNEQLEAARRERVAIACMQGLLANPSVEDHEAGDVARTAVDCADALLDELDGLTDDEDEDEDEDER